MSSPDWFAHDLKEISSSFSSKSRKVEFKKAVKDTKLFIVDNPEAGSPEYGQSLGIAGLRHKSLLDRSFKILFFYIVEPDGSLVAARLVWESSEIERRIKVIRSS